MLFSWFITSLAFDLLASLGLRPFCLSPSLVSSLLVPFLLVSFGKVLLWCFASFAPALRFTRFASCSLQSGLLSKYLHQLQILYLYHLPAF